MGWDIQRKAPNRTRQKTRGKDERTEQTPSCDLDHPHYWQQEEFHQTATDYRKETNGNFRDKNYSNSQIEGHCTTDLTKISQNLLRSQKKTKDIINWHEQVSGARRQRGQGQQSRTLLQKQSWRHSLLLEYLFGLHTDLGSIRNTSFVFFKVPWLLGMYYSNERQQQWQRKDRYKEFHTTGDISTVYSHSSVNIC